MISPPTDPDISPFPTRDDVPCLSIEQMVEVDRAMIEDYGIQLIQMMEDAGRHLAQLTRTRFLGGSVAEKKVTVMAGRGGNGGGGLACARRLAAWGAEVTVLLSAPEADFTGVPAHQLNILNKMDVAVLPAGEASAHSATDVIIDALIGYSLHGAPRGDAKALIEWANDSPSPVLALDVPSGVHADTGEAFAPAIRAAATLTLALPKCGLIGEPADDRIGELYLADISVPPRLYRSAPLGLEVEHVFEASDIVRLERESR